MPVPQESCPRFVRVISGRVATVGALQRFLDEFHHLSHGFKRRKYSTIHRERHVRFHGHAHRDEVGRVQAQIRATARFGCNTVTIDSEFDQYFSQLCVYVHRIHPKS